MFWTILAVLAVLSTKFVTSLRLKDLKAKFEEIQPKIDELRVQLAEVDDEHENLKVRETASQSRLTHLKGVVQYLENTVKSPIEGAPGAGVPDERQQVLQAAEEA
jgi:predicted  nucleic acid-binding Zn-ribbon protein